MTFAAPVACHLCSVHQDRDGFCACIPAFDLQDLGARPGIELVKRGRVIAGEIGEEWPVLTVANGVLGLQNLLNDGRRAISVLFMVGDIIDFRNWPNRRLGNLIALSDVSVCYFSPKTFDRILGTNSEARKLAWAKATSQAFRAMSHASDLAQKSALERLASFIFECRNRSDAGRISDFVEIPIRRRDIAEYLGMQPETLSRCFRELKECGLISVSDPLVVKLENVPVMRRIANGDQAAHEPLLHHRLDSLPAVASG